MSNVTCKYLKDADITIQRVEKRLRAIAELIQKNNKNNLTDINVICEEIFGKILNKLYKIKLVSMSSEVSGNFVAVDLIDYNKRVAYQVTSQHKNEKIKGTIEKFNMEKANSYRWAEPALWSLPIFVLYGDFTAYQMDFLIYTKRNTDIMKEYELFTGIDKYPIGVYYVFA